MFFSQPVTPQRFATIDRQQRVLRRQDGVSILGVLVLLALLSFFLTVTIRLLPAWMEGRSVKTAINAVAEASSAQNSLRDVTKRVQNNFNTNRIEAIKPRDVKVYRDEGKIIIDANYEKRTPLFKGVDAVLMFTDNVVVID
ncbi:MAG: DUF4845 domain-containing protein [Halieaceae bacterium]|nr:DUF4845 domain-containing protein [Halieaceae bacterium]